MWHDTTLLGKIVVVLVVLAAMSVVVCAAIFGRRIRAKKEKEGDYSGMDMGV